MKLKAPNNSGESLKSWCKRTGNNYSKIYNRISRYRMTVEEALTAVIPLPKPRVIHYYKNVPLKKWCEENDVSYNNVLRYYKKEIHRFNSVDSFMDYYLKNHKRRKEFVLIYGRRVTDYCYDNNIEPENFYGRRYRYKKMGLNMTNEEIIDDINKYPHGRFRPRCV